MSLTFDATLKTLAEDYPSDFLSTFDQAPTQSWSVLNVDLSTVTKAADLVVGLGDPLQEIVQIDFQASASATKHADMLVYNALLYRHYFVPVHSTIILLRPEAAHSKLSGQIHYANRPGRGKLDFDYEVIRLWEYPAETLLQGPLGTLPLAPLGQLPANIPKEQGLAQVIQRLIDRLIQESSSETARELVTSAFLLSGLIVDKQKGLQLFQGVKAMRESSTFMGIWEEAKGEGKLEGREEGREEEARGLILKLGQKRFGPADETIQNQLNAITNVAQLEQLAEKLLDVSSWQELFE